MQLGQCQSRSLGEATIMAVTIERKETSKILIQVNIGSQRNGVEQHARLWIEHPQ